MAAGSGGSSLGVDRWTVLDLAKAGADFLLKKGGESARLESDILLAHVLNCRRLDVYTRHDMPVSDPDRDRFRESIRRRSAGEPVAYIIGRRDFMDWTFIVDRNVLVPRSESELVVSAAVALRRDETTPGTIVEVGVGSGCILVSTLLYLPRDTGVGIDISRAAIGVARRNAGELGVGGRCRFVVADCLSVFADRHDGTIDVLVSNPPYIRRDEETGLPRDVRDFEPHLALFSPADGLWFHREIINRGSRLVSPAGALILELPGYGGDELEAAWRSVRPEGKVIVQRDGAGHERVFIGLARPLEGKNWRDLLSA